MRLRPLPVGSRGTLGLTVRLMLPSLRQRVSESSSLSAVGFADALWLCPERALRRFFALVSLFDLVALSPLLHRVFTAGFRHWCAFHFWSRRGPWGVAVAPPISPYTGPGWSPPICHVPLVLRSVFYVLLCDILPVFMAIIWSVSLTPACPLRVIPMRGCSLDTCEACV